MCADCCATARISYSGGGNGYDEAGRVKGYTYTGKGYTHTYTYAYAGWDSYREQSITGSSSNSNYRTTTTTLTYDAAGRQTEMREKTVGATLDDRVRTFAFDGNGMIVSRRDGTATSANVFQQTGTAAVVAMANNRYVHAGGQQVASLNEWGKLDVRSHLTAFSNSDSGRTQVTVQAGDTLRSLAQRVYGNESLWYVIAAANALDDGSGDGALVAGSSLTVPEVKTNSNDANTFKPYNPGEISGPSTPSLPYIQPPSESGCGKLGMVIMVVVAVVVTVYTAGALSGLVGSGMGTLTTGSAVAVGAISGAAGSAASMAVGSAMGVASFNWRGVAAGAVTGAITGGLANQYGTVGQALNGSSQAGATAAPNLLKAAGLAFANAGAVYAGQALAGTGTSFSWRSIASSVVSNLVSAKVAPGIAKGMESEFGKDFTYGMTSGMVSAAVRSSFGQTLHQSDYMTVVADAFGNALGNRLVLESRQAVSSAEKLQSINADLQARSEARLVDQIDARLAAESGVMAVSGVTGSAFRQEQAELSDLMNRVRATPEAVTPQMERRFRELSGIAAYEARNIDLTDAQVNMNTWMGHLRLLPEVASNYAEGLPLPSLGATQAEISEWRTRYQQVDDHVQGLVPHPHQEQEAGSAIEITRVLSNEEARQARLAAADASLASDGRAIVSTFLVKPVLGALGAAISPLGMSAYGFYEAKQSWDAGNKKTALVLGALSAVGVKASWGMPGRGVISQEAATLGRQYIPALKGFGTAPASPMMGNWRAQIGAVGDLKGVKPFGAAHSTDMIRADVAATARGGVVGDAALRAEVSRISREGHALARHGGTVTDEQLFVRATTGVAPDGSSVIRNGKIVIPPSSTAFYSDKLLAQADLSIRRNYLDRAIIFSKPGAQRVTIEGVDLSRPIGRGYDRVSAAPGGVGPLRYHPELSKVTGVYDYDSVTNSWRTTTIYLEP
ncbi:LysM peptidoglycan-binding domain-containing protein [Stenotrophomonas acidaminiphila]